MFVIFKNLQYFCSFYLKVLKYLISNYISKYNSLFKIFQDKLNVTLSYMCIILFSYPKIYIWCSTIWTKWKRALNFIFNGLDNWIMNFKRCQCFLTKNKVYLIRFFKIISSKINMRYLQKQNVFSKDKGHQSCHIIENQILWSEFNRKP